MSLDSHTHDVLANNAVHDGGNISNSEPGSTVSAPEERDKSSAKRAPKDAPPQAFFDAILSSTGRRCVGVLGANKKFKNRFLPDNKRLTDAVAAIDATGQETYFACASYGDDLDERTQANVHSMRSFYVDIDTQEGKPKEKYVTRKEAITALLAFCDELGIAHPWIVDSGYGVHGYWPMDNDMEPKAWKMTAELLKRAMFKWGLGFDPKRTADEASVLRPPGAHNHKHGASRKVRLIAKGRISNHAALHLKLVEFVGEDTPDETVAEFNADLAGAPREYRPSDAHKVAEKCAVVREMRDTCGNVNGQLWYDILGVLVRTTQGGEVCHEWSSGDERYTHEETQSKVERLLERTTGATTCKKLSESCPEVCEACPAWGKIRSPITLGEDWEPAVSTAQVDDSGGGDAESAGDKGATNNQPPSKSPTQTTRLLALASVGTEFFHDSDSTAFVRMSENGLRAVCRINSERFKQALLNRYLNTYGSTPTDEAIRQTVKALEAQAVYNCPERETHLRVARHGEAIYLNLARDDGAIVEVTASGWKIVFDAPVYFLRPRGMEPLPIPQGGGDIASLARILNLATKDDFILAVSWVIGALGTGPFPVALITGEQGSAKSSASLTLRKLVDPNKAPLRSLPRNEQDFAIGAQNSHVLAIDNISSMASWISDTLCKLATGGGFSYRKLYEDDVEVIFNSKRPIILNGIGDFATRGDLADRAITIRLSPIHANDRKTEQEIAAAFEREAPKLIGVLLNAVVHGLANQVTLSSRPRMADFAEWAISCEGYFDGTSLPFNGGETWRWGDFMVAYTKNRGEAAKVVLDADPVAAALEALLDKCNPWTGTATTLLAELTALAGDMARLRGRWPADATRLSNTLERLAPGLRAEGIHIGKKKRGTGGVRRFTIKRKEGEAEGS